MITDMRGADFIVLRFFSKKIRNIRNFEVGQNFRINLNRNGDKYSRGIFFGITDFFLCGGSHVESSLLPKFALLFCTCRHAWIPGVEVNAWICAPRSIDYDPALDKNLDHL